MNNADNVLEILIKIGLLTPENAEKARVALADVKDATKAGGAADADAAKDADKLTASKREMLHLLHGMPPEFRQVGYSFIQGFYNPMFAGMTALTGLFLYAKKQLDDYNKSLDEIGKTAAQADFLPGIEAKMEVLRNGAAAMQTWLDNLGQEQTGEEGIAKALADQLGLMSAIAGAKGAQAKAEEALAIAKIKQGEASGRISPADAERQITEAQAKAVAAEQAAKEKQQADQLGTKSLNLMGLEGIQKILQPIAEAAKQAQNEDEARIAGLKGFADSARANLPEANKKIADAAEKLTKAQEQIGRGDPIDALKRIRDAQDELDKARNAAAGWQKIINQYTTTQTPEAVAGAAGMKDASASAEKLAGENAKNIGDLKISIAELTKTIAGVTGPERATSRTKQQGIFTEGITAEENRANADLKTIGEFAGRPRNSLSPADIAKIKNAYLDMHDAISDASALISDLASVGGDVSQMKKDMADLKQRMSASEHGK